MSRTQTRAEIESALDRLAIGFKQALDRSAPPRITARLFQSYNNLQVLYYCRFDKFYIDITEQKDL